MLIASIFTVLLLSENLSEMQLLNKYTVNLASNI